jgi:hypothetical protein
MESLARAERLRELQARNAERAAGAGQDYKSLLAETCGVVRGPARKSGSSECQALEIRVKAMEAV